MLKMSSNIDTCVTEVTSSINRIKMVPESLRKESSISHNADEIELTTSASQSPDTPGGDIPDIIATDSFRLRMFNTSTSPSGRDYSLPKIQIPIVGYEVMEERARFTVYKLRIENKSNGECWFVFRRYTDFVRLHSRLKSEFPSIKLSIPRKRWFGDNFNPDFLEERIQGLQYFVNSILEHQELYNSPTIKDFFCFDEPPPYVESVEESRAIFETLEETVYHLRHQLREKESELNKIKSTVMSERMKNDDLNQFVRDCMKNCPQCTKEFIKLNMSPQYTSTPVKHLRPEESSNEDEVKSLQSTPVIKCDSAESSHIQGEVTDQGIS